MKVTSGYELVGVDHDHRVVRGRVHLHRQRVGHPVERVIDDPMHLRRAPQRVAVLHFAAILVAARNFGGTGDGGEKGAHAMCHPHLSFVGPSSRDAGVEGPVAPHESLERQSGGHIRLRQQDASSNNRLAPKAGDHLSPVDHGEPLLSPEDDRLATLRFQDLESRTEFSRPRVAHLPLAEEPKRQVGEWGQVSRGAQSTLAGDAR
mmetsp:Transcript_28444/g.67309  ORF Transcript_28444/g.67309 Transcript_28444/m.67309 type:complete len:205 (-) Transcript_28444:103-717(-)